MPMKGCKKPLKERLKHLFRDRSATSLAPSLQSTGMLTRDTRAPVRNSQSIAAVQSPKPEDVAHRTRASSSTTTDPHVPPSNPRTADTRAIRVSTDGGANAAQEPATASPPEKSSKSVEHGPQEPTFATSQRLWNAAYDSLEVDEKELVGSYVKTLETVLCFEASKDPASDIAKVVAELKDPSQRQIHMQRLVKEGQAKVAKASKITKGIGDFVEAILKVKPMVDLAIQGIPQAAPAALPWAGVCVGLQVSSYP